MSKDFCFQNFATTVYITRYDRLVAKEDQQDMSPTVCYNFCRSLGEGFNYFGLNNGRRCFCTPYYKAKAGERNTLLRCFCTPYYKAKAGERNLS
jgi:hypothetical protein